ncbi:MAG: MFS transporter, partial [Saprospiraceae bacterium]
MKDLLDNKTMTGYQWLIVVLCVILNFNDGIDVLIVSYSSTDIIREWDLTKAEMGYVFSAGLLGMMVGALAIAPFGDTWGRKKIFVLSLILITSGMLFVSICSSYKQLILLRFITGSG